jgi:hypothetical protein
MALLVGLQQLELVKTDLNQHERQLKVTELAETCFPVRHYTQMLLSCRLGRGQSPQKVSKKFQCILQRTTATPEIH